MSIRVCPLCQAEFLEYKNTCTHCGVALVDPSEDIDIRLLDDDEQVIYDLSAWPIDAQTETAMLLAESSLPHLWDGTDVILPAVHESAADQLLERIEDQFGLVSAEERDMLTEHDAESADPDAVAESLGGETEFDLIGWDTARRAELVSRLVELGVTHHWEDDVLVVPTAREEDVDSILDDMGAGGGPVGGVDDIAPMEIASTLFLVADRMRKGKIDAERHERLVEVLGSADPARSPYGWDIKVWEQALELGDDLADAVADDTDDVETIAGSLYDLLRPLI